MSKSSRRRQAWRKKQSQNNGEQVASQTEPILKVWPQASWGDADSLDDDLDDSLFEPITTGSQSQAVSESKAQPESKPQAQSESQKCSQKQASVPEWIEGYLKYQSEFMEQIANQIVEDHQILTDHDWRLYDVEKRLGLLTVASQTKAEPEPAPAPDLKVQPESKPQAQPEPQPKPQTKVKAKSEPEPQPKPQTKVKAKSEPEPQPQSETGFPEYIIPKEMYEAKSFEGGKWRLRGPYKRISQAEQAAKGDLSKVKIVQVWYNTHNDRVVRQLTAEEMEKYC